MTNDPRDRSPPLLQGGLAAIAKQGSSKGPAPVHLWNPPYCGDIGLEIRADGSWWYQGSIIARRALVELFASVLRKDDDGLTYLVTPVEKILIKVADAPFLGVEMIANGARTERMLKIRTNLGEWVAIGPDHPLRFIEEPASGGLRPYVLVRGRLEALLTREVTRGLMALALEEFPDLATPENAHVPAVWSGGVRWCLQPK